MVAGDRPATLQPQQDFPTNRGGLCSKGWTAASPPRSSAAPADATGPQRPGDRRSEFRPASWDEALELIATKIIALQAAYGPDSVGCFGGGGLTNEKAYAFGKFARVGLRTAMIDYNGRFCMSSAATAANRAFGIDRGLPFPLADVAQAQAILLVGSNPAATMPPAMQCFDAGRANGADAHRGRPTAHRDRRRRHPPSRAAAGHRPGARERAAAPGDQGRLRRRRTTSRTRTKGFAAVKAGVALYWPDRVERITGSRCRPARTIVGPRDGARAR